MRTNIFAYTPPGFEPPYVSLNERDDGTVQLTVRSLRLDGEALAKQADIVLPPEELIKFRDECNRYFERAFLDACYGRVRQ